MTDLMWAAVILLAALQGGLIGYKVGRIREQNRLIPEILEERDRANRLALLLKMAGGGVMTIDKAKLKALAEAATQGNWVAEGDDLFFNEDGYTKHLMETSEGSDICHDAEHPANLSFIAAASPDTILALLAEIERLAKFEDWFIRLDQVEQSLAASYKAERDQLKAENEALRKDALRYRWLRQASATDGEYTHGVCIDLWENGCGFEVTLEEADAAVDTAMAKEANRD